jgi:hypothetical protein
MFTIPMLKSLKLRSGITMSEEQGQRPTRRIVSDTGGSIEYLATVTAEARAQAEIVIAVETIRELVSAIRAGSPEISYHKPALPKWLPRVLVWAFLFLFVHSALAYVYFVAREAMSRGYDIELTVRAMKPSVTLRATKPSNGDAPPHSGFDASRKGGRSN